MSLIGIILGVVTIVVLAVGAMFVVYSVVYTVRELKRKYGGDTCRLSPGDVLICPLQEDNPYVDVEWMYETVTDVKTNGKGETYFKSYTSNINGVRNPVQGAFPSHSKHGSLFLNKDWRVANHIDTNKIDG